MTRVAKGSYAVRVGAAEHPLWKGRAPLLTDLDVELTERCNSNCIHCWINLPAGDEAARKRELSTAALEAILIEAAALGALSVRFTGGEPLLREDFAELYVRARRLGLKVILATNARRMTPGLADLLARIPPREPVEVTVYGMTQASYEAVSRTPGSFAQFQRGLRLLLARRIPLVVRGVHLPQNQEDRDAFESWAATIPGMDRGRAGVVFLDLRARRDDPARNRQIARLRVGPRECVEVLRRGGEEYARDAFRICSRFMGPRGDRLFTCGAGRRVCLDAYGVLQPCLALRHPETVYDLKAGSLEDALRVFFPRLRRARATNPEYLARCARCFLHGFCDQCPAKSWMEHGTLDTPVQYLCDVAHARACDLGLLGQDESGWEVDDWRERLESCKRHRGETGQAACSPTLVAARDTT
jgi:radical SAM protein with 4Fe4S-binding SPASM domain